jgi:1-deoxy-D-xylulose-5-phosphate reductoisomerase
MKLVGVFGSTGSVGENTLRIVKHHSTRFAVHTLAGGRNVQRLAEQALEMRPRFVITGDGDTLLALRERLGPRAAEFRLLAGPEGLAEAAGDRDVDIVVSAITGAQGLPVSLAAVRAGKRLGLANKESMVMAGPLLNGLALATGAEIIPIDSEHSALFQCLLTGRRDDVAKLILTASGGPFRTLPKDEFKNVTLEQALKHPTWTMGPKITIDSATMMNKALEIVEARWLFHLDRSKLDVVVHPQSVVHSMVLWRDGSVIAQMGAPDMRIPIQYAMTYPDRLDGSVATYSPEIFDGLNFYAPDLERFPSIAMGYFAAERAGTYGAVLNAANERAVELFTAREIAFHEIFERVGAAVDRHRPVSDPTLSDILAADAWAREEIAR